MDMDNNQVELLFEHLRHIRERVDSTDTAIRDVKQMVISLRSEVHSLRGDILRQEQALAGVESDVDRIKARLDIVDQPTGQ